MDSRVTLWLFNIAMENGPFIDDFPLKPPFNYKGFSMAMLNNQRVIVIKSHLQFQHESCVQFRRKK